ncbi:MAG: hypothetical protein GW748_02775 [Alphaproteobacteria bacterium]|nr:hypothetical protein [Alphaproteobacteria bacterium]NCQ66651.1 hypothetical protein [Alphaproteobacteria bacterium]NCT07003.1 hypothetical protein [Alphaproteobacteria bacterium]
MKYIKLLSLAFAATLTSQNAMAIGSAAVQKVDESLEQARKDAETRLAEADTAQKALVKKAAEEAARNAGPEADALKTAGIEINDSNKAAVKLLLDLNAPATLVTAGNLKSILAETTDIKKKAAALLLKTGLYDKRNNTSKKRGEEYSYLQAAEAFANNEKAWKTATRNDLKYWRQHAGHPHNKDTVGKVAGGQHYN